MLNQLYRFNGSKSLVRKIQSEIRRAIHATPTATNSTKKETKLQPTKDDEKTPATEDETKDYIQYEKNGPITIISLNRPDKRNAITPAMASRISEAISQFESDETSTVGVLHGIGGSFSAGFDLNELQSETIKSLFLNQGTVGPTRRLIRKPMVCGISGYCIANGLELALMCDLRVVEDDSYLGFFNRRFGVPIMDGGTIRLPAMIGLSRALDLILTGRNVSAKEAFEMGLANRIVAPGTSLGQAVNLANCLAKFPQATLNHDRNSVYRAAFEGQSFDKSCQNEIMSVTKEVIVEMQSGAKQFEEGIGKKGKSSNIKEKSMADWEIHEYRLELEKEKTKQINATMDPPNNN